MHVTTKKLQNLGLSGSDIKTGFCRKSTFLTNFDGVMNNRARAAVNTIDNAIQGLVEKGILPKESRTSARGISADGKTSYIYGYIEQENGGEYLVLQVNVTPGTFHNPKGIISASTYWGASSEVFVTDTLDSLLIVKDKIVEKLKEYCAAHANEKRPAGLQAVSMLFADGAL